MMRPDSPHWNWETGVCKKHLLPQVPCPACLHTNDPDVYDNSTANDRFMDELLDDVYTTGTTS